MTDVDDWMLAIDASTPRCVVVLGRLGDADGPLFADEQDDDGRRASAELHLRAAELLRRAGVTAGELACVGCGCGPGTFTGTRVAVALCMGLAEATRRRVVAVSTLAAVAASIDGPGPALALLDARRGEVYAGRFALGESVAATGPQECTTVEAALVQAAGHHVVGPGVSAYAERIPPEITRTALPGPSARGLWRAAVSAHRRDGCRDPASIEATYLRESYAELGVNVARRPMFRSPLV